MMKYNFKKYFEGKNAVLFALTDSKYQDEIRDITVAASKTFAKICYISLNKPYNSMLDLFRKNGVDENKICFIDSASGRAPKPGEEKITSFVSSPKALTDISISISKSMKNNTDISLLDSLSTLLIYNDSATTLKFVHYMVSKTRELNKKCIIIIMKSDMNATLMKDMTMFVDDIKMIK